MSTRSTLAELVRAAREELGISQDQLAAQIGKGINRSIIAHLEQDRRMPDPEVLTVICEFLKLPATIWRPFAEVNSKVRLHFEEILSELLGQPVSTDGLLPESVKDLERLLDALFKKPVSDRQMYDIFNSILTYYGAQVSYQFFRGYFGSEAFSSLDNFSKAVSRYQRDAVRLFSTLSEAFRQLGTAERLDDYLRAVQPTDLSIYHERSEWQIPHDIPDERLPDLGYISAARVKQEMKERTALKEFLEKLARDIREKGPNALEERNEKTKRRMDSFLRKFNSSLRHGVLSPLFVPDADEIAREAKRIAPKTADELERMGETQTWAIENLSSYLTADYMDAYVATSMRSDADYVSVNSFVKRLFSHTELRQLKLRYFNPTQSWIDDRVGKGLVEALMLKRSSLTIYMAQKQDTFGKDSEASVALGQGKPVVVYVPKLQDASGIDSEKLSSLGRSQLMAMLETELKDDIADIDESMDDEALIGRILHLSLEKLDDDQLSNLVRNTWADFDLYGESERIETPERRADYRQCLDDCIGGENKPTFGAIRKDLIGILVAATNRFERRAKTFKEIHPLALQVILSTGVLNGILVVRSVDQCAHVIHDLLNNKLTLKFEKDDVNYRLVEERTGSTIRVISRIRLIRNAFENHYRT